SALVTFAVALILLLRCCLAIHCDRLSFFPRSALPIPSPPSFPTRRSSDLICCSRRASVLGTARGSNWEMSRCCRMCRRAARPPRSEEHTSKLQSPDHLVCRLLLEKKKKKKL